MTTLFIDTNIFLSLYAFTDDDIEKLRDVFVLSQEREIDFILTRQVVDEFWRNREVKISECLRGLKTKEKLAIPMLARDYAEADEALAAHRAFDKAMSKLVANVNERARTEELAADHLIKDIFRKSKVVETSEGIIAKAKRRTEIGNPPGKSGSLGDAINWECVLSQLGFFEELCFISRDADYASRLDPGRFNEFLRREINEQACSVAFFPSLSAFLKDRFPQVRVEAFEEAGRAVADLEASSAFSSTHGAIARLAVVEYFTRDQIQRLITAAEENTQVRWILGDDDVADFYGNLHDKYSDQMSHALKARLDSIVSRKNADEASHSEINEDFPF